MNVVLATYYGTAPLQKLSAAMKGEVQELVQLRQAYLHHTSNTPVPDDLVRSLGGREAMTEKLSSAALWLRAWDEGEKKGHQLAIAGMEALFEHAQEEQ